ncbi:MAG: hypothetical protein ACFHX7_02000 [Pseudomonadota bacterium]
MKKSLILLVLFLLGGCQSSLNPFPRGELQGDERQTNSFAFAADFQVLALETRPQQPYTVNLMVVVINGELYVDAAEQRRWHQHIMLDPRVRVGLGGHIYRAIAEKTADPVLAGRFLPGRVVYRLVPRAWSL